MPHLDPSPLVSRRRLLGGAAAVAALGAAHLAAGPGLLALADTPRRLAGAAFRTRSAPTSRSLTPVTGVRSGRAVSGSARRLVAATAPETLRVTVDPSEKEDYWYFAQGVVLTATGLFADERAVIEDVGPDGRVVGLGSFVADSKGVLTATLKYPTLFPARGRHLLRVSARSGQTGSAVLSVVRWEQLAYTVSTGPARISAAAWLDTPVTVRATGLPARTAVTLHVIQPDGVGYTLGADERLRSETDGTFTYQIQATSVLVPAGTWEVIVSTSDGKQGYTTFTLETPKPPKRVGAVTMAKTVTLSQLASDAGLAYRVSKMRPFDLVLVTLRTARGIDNVLGVFRLDGDGAHRNSVISAGAIPTGDYTLIVQSSLTGRYQTGTFTVTDDKGNVGTPLRLALAKTSVTRLEAVDLRTGIVARASGFRPGDVVSLDVTDAENVRLALNTESIAARPADSDGKVVFSVAAHDVPRTGAYTVTATSYAGGDPVVLRQPLRITR